MSSSPDTTSDSQIHEEDHSPESSGDVSPSLPQYTRVLIVGNNRTKRSLVGQKALVKKSVGLGGWHLLMLSSGEEVRLQRNALSVLETPTEQDFSSVAHRKLLASRMSSPDVASTQSFRRPVHTSNHSLGRINFLKLETTALKRYRKYFNLAEVGPNSSKEQLASAVGQHFRTQTVNEVDVLASFLELRHKRDRC